MSDNRMRERFLDCSNLTMEEAESFGTEIVTLLRDLPFWLGDLARYAEARWPDTYQQIFPDWTSPGLLARHAGVCRAYPKEEDRAHRATYSQYLQVAGKPDRQKLLAEFVEKGLTTDESRKSTKATGDAAVPPGVPAVGGQGSPPPGRWLLAIDCNYFLHRFWHSGAGVEAATGVASWIGRTVERLKEKGLTDVACCFDSHLNHRKELTKDWEDKYKDRPPKPVELGQQLHLLLELIGKAGFATVSVEGMEADDVMASYAKQFDGRVTLLTQDKDQRQCLSSKCNILLDVEWKQDDHSGDVLPVYKWVSAKSHTEDKGIPPEQWVAYQCIAGDNVDGIKGVQGIGEKGGADLVKMFGTVEAVIAAARADDERIKPKQRKAILEFEPKLDVTRRLVTLVDNLVVPNSTRLT